MDEDTNLSCDIPTDKTKDIVICEDNNDTNDPNLVTHIRQNKRTQQEAQTWKLETSKMALINGRNTDMTSNSRNESIVTLNEDREEACLKDIDYRALYEESQQKIVK